MENHRCKLCFRKFVNGKALGGHMRSHTMNLRSVSSSSSEEEDQEEKSGVLSSSFAVLQDRESETDSSKKRPICRRSERVGKSRISNLNMIKMEESFLKEEKVKINECLSPFLDPECLSSSVSGITHKEDAAHCLIMLSRDHKRKRDEIEYGMGEKDNKFGDDNHSEDSCEENVVKNKVRAKSNTKYYRCEICSKLFRDLQALGDHRASHNKIKVNTRDSGGSPKSTAAAAVETMVVCPFCPRVFTSVQAFGGHKKTHLIVATAKTTGPAEPFSRNGECFNIDLNLPASFDDEILMQN